MKLSYGKVEIECTPDEAAELLTQLRKRQTNVPWDGQPYRAIIPPDSAASYRFTVGRTYSAGTSGDSVHNYEVWHRA